MSMTTDPAVREAFIAGLRDLADFLAANPALAVSVQLPQQIRIVPYGSDEECERAIDEFAAAAGAEITDDRAGTGRYSAARAFGAVVYEALTYTAASLAASEARRSYADNVQTAAPARVLDEAA
jgi:hypothetical protein